MYAENRTQCAVRRVCGFRILIPSSPVSSLTRHPGPPQCSALPEPARSEQDQTDQRNEQSEEGKQDREAFARDLGDAE